MDQWHSCSNAGLFIQSLSKKKAVARKGAPIRGPLAIIRLFYMHFATRRFHVLDLFLRLSDLRVRSFDLTVMCSLDPEKRNWAFNVYVCHSLQKWLQSTVNAAIIAVWFEAPWPTWDVINKCWRQPRRRSWKNSTFQSSCPCFILDQRSFVPRYFWTWPLLQAKKGPLFSTPLLRD